MTFKKENSVQLAFFTVSYRLLYSLLSYFEVSTCTKRGSGGTNNARAKFFADPTCVTVELIERLSSVPRRPSWMYCG